MSRKIFVMLTLGFTCGLPYMLIYSTLGTWLADLDISLAVVGFFAWLTLTYSLKFLWSPLVDRFEIPFFKNLGLRRGWILFCQIIIIINIIALSFLNPNDHIYLIAAFALIIAFFGSLQDISVDAYRIELAPLSDQGNLAASYQFGYRVAILLATSAALIFADFYNWNGVYQILGITMLIGVLGVFVGQEVETTPPTSGYFKNLVASLSDFFNRFGLFVAGIILFIIATYRLTDIIVGPMTNPFYLQMGFTKTEIGALVKTIALGASIAGFFVGGTLIKKLSLFKSLLIGGILVLITNIFFGYVAISEQYQHDHIANLKPFFDDFHPKLNILSLVVGLDSFAAGLVGTVNITFLTSLVSKKFTASQYALLTSFMMLPGKIFSGFSGIIAMYFKDLFGFNFGWGAFFLLTSALTLPALLTIFFNKRISRQLHQ